MEHATNDSSFSGLQTLMGQTSPARLILRAGWCALVALAMLAGLATDSRGEDIVTNSIPKYGSRATRLYHRQQYVRRAEAPDFWAMMPYYVSQFNERSCSVASATMVLNSIRATQELTADDELITQEQLLDKIDASNWKKTVGPVGGGVSIEELGRYLRRAIDIYDLGDYTVDAVRLNANRTDHLDHIRQVLKQNERSADDFLIVFFWQKELTDDPEGATGHVAPVAAFDEENDQVLIFDPDRQWYEPYWVSTETLVAGMSKLDRNTGRPRGYVWVRPSLVAETARADR